MNASLRSQDKAIKSIIIVAATRHLTKNVV